MTSSTTRAEVWVVAPDGSGDAATIQEAIDAADSLDVIELLDGVFTGPGNRNLDFAGAAITLRSRSDDPGACVLDCEGDSAGIGEPRRGFLFQSGEGPATVIRGITIRNGLSGGE